MKSSPPLHLILAAAVLLGAVARDARGEMIHTAPTDVVAAHAEIVVRAKVDPETGRAEVVSTYRGDVQGTIQIRNLRDFTDAGALPGALSPTREAILFLDELDGRYDLVHTSSPAWIRPHAAILYLSPDGKVLHYGQVLSGVLQLGEWEGVTRETLEAALSGWLRAPRAPRAERPSLDAADAARIHALVDPFVDLHLREVVREPGRPQLVRMLAALETLATDARGELRHRAIEALLVLAQQWGPDQERRGLAESRLVRLLGQLGAEPFVEPCLDEIRSPAVSASRRTAAKLLRRVGGPPRERARTELLHLLEKDRATLGTEAYFALRDLGFPVEAEEALRSQPAEER